MDQCLPLDPETSPVWLSFCHSICIKFQYFFNLESPIRSIGRLNWECDKFDTTNQNWECVAQRYKQWIKKVLLSYWRIYWCRKPLQSEFSARIMYYIVFSVNRLTAHTRVILAQLVFLHVRFINFGIKSQWKNLHTSACLWWLPWMMGRMLKMYVINWISTELVLL